MSFYVHYHQFIKAYKLNSSTSGHGAIDYVPYLESCHNPPLGRREFGDRSKMVVVGIEQNTAVHSLTRSRLQLRIADTSLCIPLYFHF